MSRPIEEPTQAIDLSNPPDYVREYYFGGKYGGTYWEGVPVTVPNDAPLVSPDGWATLDIKPKSQFDIRREEVINNDKLSSQVKHQLLAEIDREEREFVSATDKLQAVFDPLFEEWWSKQKIEPAVHHPWYGLGWDVPLIKDEELAAAKDELKQRIYDALFGAFERTEIYNADTLESLIQSVAEDAAAELNLKLPSFADTAGFYDTLYRPPTGDDPGGAAYQIDALTYAQWRQPEYLFLKSKEIFLKHYGKTNWEEEIEKNPTLYGYYSKWTNLLTYLDLGTPDARRALIDTLLELNNDASTSWMVDEFETFALTAPTKEEFVADVYTEFDEKWAFQVATDAEVVAQENTRMQWVALYLGKTVDELTLQEQIAIKNNADTMSPADQARYSEIAEAYVFFGATGMGPTEERMEAKARAAYDTFMSSEAAAQLKEMYPDFETLYLRWRQYTNMAFLRAENSAFMLEEIGNDLIIPFGIETFENWFAYDRALTMIEHDIQMGTPLSAEQLGPLFDALEALGLDPTAENAAFLQRQTGENDAEYYQRLKDTLGLDDDAINLGISHGIVAPAYGEVLEQIRPDVNAAVTRYFLPRVLPQYREQFMDEMGERIDWLWNRFVQRKGIEWPNTGNVAENAAAIEQYSQMFIDWMSQQNFAGGDMMTAFGSMIEQREAEAGLRRYTTTKRLTPTSFGLGM